MTALKSVTQKVLIIALAIILVGCNSSPNLTAKQIMADMADSNISVRVAGKGAMVSFSEEKFKDAKIIATGEEEGVVAYTIRISSKSGKHPDGGAWEGEIVAIYEKTKKGWELAGVGDRGYFMF